MWTFRRINCSLWPILTLGSASGPSRRIEPRSYVDYGARVVQGKLSDVIAYNEWPACSPDLNPVDYSVWAVPEAGACSKPHCSTDSLNRALEKTWNKLSARYLRATVDAFPERLKACVKANGGIFEIH
uniref:Uncharacterized protein n=1 Tax=Haemonchus contortus TaxID=6289 RepID=W6NAJ1_HAECO